MFDNLKAWYRVRRLATAKRVLVEHYGAQADRARMTLSEKHQFMLRSLRTIADEAHTAQWDAAAARDRVARAKPGAFVPIDTAGQAISELARNWAIKPDAAALAARLRDPEIHGPAPESCGFDPQQPALGGETGLTTGYGLARARMAWPSATAKGAELEAAATAAAAHFRSLTPEQQEAELQAQKASFARAELAFGSDADEALDRAKWRAAREAEERRQDEAFAAGRAPKGDHSL